MLFRLNEFLMAVSFALDFVEMDILGMASNHGKRTAYISISIAKELGLNSEELHDVAALAMLHDNGLSEYSLHEKLATKELKNAALLEGVKEHCTIGEGNIKNYPLITNVKNIIKYHHERYDGTGFFRLRGEEIPLMSQIIAIADALEKTFDLQNNNHDMQNKVCEFVKDQENVSFSSRIVKAFFKVTEDKTFWMDLENSSISMALEKRIPKHSLELSFEEIHGITNVLSKIIDSKSSYTQRHSQGLSEKAAIMADFYNLEKEEKMKLIIAADLHDIGKLAVPNDVLDKPDKLSDEEFKIIMKHPEYTRLALQEIKGFEDITEWASNHHEKLNGKGYPIGMIDEELDFNSRLMTCLDIYQALTEERPYREGLAHEKAMEILKSMMDNGFIDTKITRDIDYVFSKLS
ncbi:HD-GYP domain-containing protein [Clostridium beijerinckii]|uniref:HD-GYP domain-containing protein (C-di-GMP phosphodiesterase class II) n=1 Tax=Clostridium beijerinckii TaxID=1520 RepID=A0A9Q5CI40_CLOBE|nr:HD domain-containing phosphohydrolase [Clostridium beijerinckii]AQS05800.1 cyclic di-GMP phosphodiesterase response regulator RpfG [Clostridium beijerinckii]MBA2885431.1 HD-GYP domain-containing protein (c-di-GMP phosphodiesterase class II) [Clostridium beijerinckii]MBA2900068.1 HD-GYP domain-containing protein (c-di-GMP phosphodiesterase class II) [Clostridium beijerinckii]MBA2909697.1 HD-GYP domain-containing protein (c-di-GMP phosphodiesterase class II) [Clostridium beijerinckii]MBA90146